MPPQVGVRPGTAPVLLEKHPQPHLGRPEVFLRIERAQNRIGGNLGIKPFDDAGKHRMAADFVIEGCWRCHTVIVPHGQTGSGPPTVVIGLTVSIAHERQQSSVS